MLNYIRAEFYKVFRRKYTWITLIAALALEALLVAGWAFTNAHGNRVDFYTGAGMLTYMMSLGFFATLLTCDMVFAGQYKHSTLKNEVSFGIPRSRIYLGKLIVQTALSILFCLVMLGFYLGLCYAVLYHDPEADREVMTYVGYCLAVAFPLWLGVQACTCAFCFQIKSDLGWSIASVCTFYVLPAVLELAYLILNWGPLSTALQTIRAHMPTILADGAAQMLGDWGYCGKAWLVGAVWWAVSTAAGLWGFSKKEIK